MTGYTFQELRRAIEQCNARKGYGRIAEFRRYADGKLQVRITRPHMGDTWRTGRIANKTVYFAGTSARVHVLTNDGVSA